MYTKQFEIRWSDVDANRHLRNSAYIDYMSHTRMCLFLESGLDHQHLVTYNLAPVALYEHMYYFKEAFPDKPITVSLQLKGLSEDGMFFQYLHNFYDEKGRNLARCEMMGAFIDLNTRKLTNLPEEILKKFEFLSRTDDFKVITKDDTRKYGMKPTDI
jgi:acyl-CoA thioester hydrolase